MHNRFSFRCLESYTKGLQMVLHAFRVPQSERLLRILNAHVRDADQYASHQEQNINSHPPDIPTSLLRPFPASWVHPIIHWAILVSPRMGHCISLSWLLLRTRIAYEVLPYTHSIPAPYGTRNMARIGLKESLKGVQLPSPSAFQAAAFRLISKSVHHPLLQPTHTYHSINNSYLTQFSCK